MVVVLNNIYFDDYAILDVVHKFCNSNDLYVNFTYYGFLDDHILQISTIAFPDQETYNLFKIVFHENYTIAPDGLCVFYMKP